MSSRQKIWSVQLRNKLIGSNNRSCYQLRKKRHVESIIQNIFHRINTTAINIHQITDTLECIKRNSYRQQNHINTEQIRSDNCISQHGEIVSNNKICPQQHIYQIRKEIRIFEITQYQQIDYNSDNQPQLSTSNGICFSQCFSRQETKNCCKQKNERKNPACLVIKKDTYKKQKRIPHQKFALKRNQQHQHHRKKHPKIQLSKK